MTTHEEEQNKAEALTVIEPIDASKIKEGTAQIEPQFKVLRHNIKFVTAQTFKELHKALLQAEELEEQVVEIDFSMEGYPLDCIVQVNRAIWEVYGFSHAKERMTFFGPIPPKRLNIKTNLTDSVQVVYGEMAPPAWEGGSLDMSVDMKNPLSLSITGQIKRKFEPAVKSIVRLAEKLIQEKSIYRGNAVELDLNYIVTGEFDPAHCAPKFINVAKQVNLILPKKIEDKLNHYLWNVIRHPEYFRVNNVPVKTGILLQGEPGTGKTLTAYYTAQIAIENNMTYLYLKGAVTAATFLAGYRMAQLYGPSVYFVEDCDVLFGKDRDEEMNRMLETLDGITAKNAEVITIFTTNYPKKLNQAFTRSGRINQQITLTAPDAEAAARFVQLMSARVLAPDVDFEAVGAAFANLVQSDIKNGCNIADQRRIGFIGPDIEGKVTTDDLLFAADEVWEKVKGNVTEENPHEVALKKAKEGMGIILGNVSKDMTVVKESTEKTEKIAGKIAKKFGV